jgi:hypothetical protein
MADSDYEIAVGQRDAKTGQFLPGCPGGPGRGSKVTVSRTFLQNMEAAWIKDGEKLIDRVIKEDPSTALRVFASLVPREALLRHHMNREKVVDPDVARAEVERLLEEFNSRP